VARKRGFHFKGVQNVSEVMCRCGRWRCAHCRESLPSCRDIYYTAS